MEVEIIKKSDNPLFKRTEVEFRVDHSNAPTPKRLDVRTKLASLLGFLEELLVIDKLTSSHGKQTASGIARAYTTRKQLEDMEPKYLLERGIKKEPKQEKPAEEKPKEPKEKQPAKGKEPKQEKPAEEKPKELDKEAGEDMSGKES